MTINNYIGVNQTAPMGGYLMFPSIIDFTKSVTYPAVTMPLYVDSHPIPIRNYNHQDEVVVGSTDWSGKWGGSAMTWFGNPDPLTLQVSGWFVTPTTPYVFPNQFSWMPTHNGLNTGTQLTGTLAMSYPDIVMAYIEGRMGRSPAGSPTRVQPTEFADGYGYRYSNPKIMNFSADYTPSLKRQTFSMTLWLES